jgi:hypothetical protein
MNDFNQRQTGREFFLNSQSLSRLRISAEGSRWRAG